MKQPVFLKIIKPIPANFTKKKKIIGRKPGVSKNFRKIRELALDTETQGCMAKSRSHQRFSQGMCWPWHHHALPSAQGSVLPSHSKWLSLPLLSLPENQSVGKGHMIGWVLVKCLQAGPRSPEGTYLFLSSFQRGKPDLDLHSSWIHQNRKDVWLLDNPKWQMFATQFSHLRLQI